MSTSMISSGLVDYISQLFDWNYKVYYQLMAQASRHYFSEDREIKRATSFPVLPWPRCLRSCIFSLYPDNLVQYRRYENVK